VNRKDIAIAGAMQRMKVNAMLTAIGRTTIVIAARRAETIRPQLHPIRVSLDRAVGVDRPCTDSLTSVHIPI
jgi:hypothetical protein